MMNPTGFLKFFVTLACASAMAVLLGACEKQELENVEVKSVTSQDDQAEMIDGSSDETDAYLWM